MPQEASKARVINRIDFEGGPNVLGVAATEGTGALAQAMEATMSFLFFTGVVYTAR
jgi:hypothetical protein